MNSVYIDRQATNNSVIANTLKYISIVGGSNNRFYLNNFEGLDGFFINRDVVIDGNTFYYEGVGNYWSNYNGTDDNGDGIGDSPHEIRDGLEDPYPLMQPYNASDQTAPPKAKTQPSNNSFQNLQLLLIALVLTVACVSSLYFVHSRNRLKSKQHTQLKDIESNDRPKKQ
jgi:hypothetical protein